MKTIDLNGKTALVTGGAGQLGREIVRGLAECGANVVISYNTSGEYANELKEEITKKYGVKAITVQADITCISSIEKMKAYIKSEFEHVDILVLNAVIQYVWATIIDQNPEDYESQFKSSIMQFVYMTKAFVPDMIEKRSGRVIAINSECAMQAFAYQSAYVAGKRGLDGLMRVLAREVGEYNITVNEVAPGFTISDNCRNDGPEVSNRHQDWAYIDRVPLRRRGKDEDVANAVCFLASDMASFMTGVYLSVSGGNVMPCI